MKTDLTISQELGFDVLCNEEMKSISGGEEYFLVYDPITGEYKIVVRPSRPQ